MPISAAGEVRRSTSALQATQVLAAAVLLQQAALAATLTLVLKLHCTSVHTRFLKPACWRCRCCVGARLQSLVGRWHSWPGVVARMPAGMATQCIAGPNLDMEIFAVKEPTAGPNLDMNTGVATQRTAGLNLDRETGTVKEPTAGPNLEAETQVGTGPVRRVGLAAEAVMAAEPAAGLRLEVGAAEGMKAEAWNLAQPAARVICRLPSKLWSHLLSGRTRTWARCFVLRL